MSWMKEKNKLEDLYDRLNVLKKKINDDGQKVKDEIFRKSDRSVDKLSESDLGFLRSLAKEYKSEREFYDLMR